MATVSHILQNLKTLCKVIVFCSSTCCGSNSETDPTLGEEDVDVPPTSDSKESLLDNHQPNHGDKHRDYASTH